MQSRCQNRLRGQNKAAEALSTRRGSDTALLCGENLYGLYGYLAYENKAILRPPTCENLRSQDISGIGSATSTIPASGSGPWAFFLRIGRPKGPDSHIWDAKGAPVGLREVNVFFARKP